MKISKNLFVFLLGIILCHGFDAQAQRKQVIITGQVVEAETQAPMEYATLIVQHVDDPGIITGGVTDLDGKFAVTAAPGRYNIRVEFISYQPYLLPDVALDGDLALDTVALKVDVEQLETVEIVAEKTTMEVRLDKKIYRIGNDLTVGGGSVSEALDNLPAITVGIDGDIGLRGNENVRVLINGKPSAISGFGSTDVLSQLPADAIDRVEVVTSPSARYDAQGTAGIINIVLKREKSLGFNGTVNGAVGSPAMRRLSTHLNWRRLKHNIFGSASYRYGRPPGNALFDNRYGLGEFSRIIEDRTISRLDEGFNMNVGMEYFLNKHASITGALFAKWSDEEDLTTNRSQRFVAETLDSRTYRENLNLEQDNRYQASLNYTNEIAGDEHKFTADIQYGFRQKDEETAIEEANVLPDERLLAREQIFEDELKNELLLQADYVRAIGDGQFEAGFRSKSEWETNDFRLDTLNLLSNQFETDQNLSNEFSYLENVNALYTQFGQKFGDFSVLMGLRFEHTQLNGEVVSNFDLDALRDLLGGDVQLDFNRHYFGLFPTVNLIFEINEEDNITIGYNRRINRPRGSHVNPFPSRSSRTNLFQGNPSLEPAFSNAFDLGYVKQWGEVTLTTSVYYQKETGAVEVVREETGEVTVDGVRVIRSIPVNLSTNQRFGGEAALMFWPLPSWRLNSSINLFRFVADGEFNGVDFGNVNTSWFSRISSKVTLPGSFQWQTNLLYRAPRQNAQRRIKGIFSMNMAISKDILDKKGTIALNIRDVFNSRVRRSVTQTEFFTSESDYQSRERQARLSFRYRINYGKERKKEKRTEEEDVEY